MTRVPESRVCGRGCCWNNYGTCGMSYKCRCHTIRRDTPHAARLRLEDYLDLLGDE